MTDLADAPMPILAPSEEPKPDDDHHSDSSGDAADDLKAAFDDQDSNQAIETAQHKLDYHQNLLNTMDRYSKKGTESKRYKAVKGRVDKASLQLTTAKKDKDLKEIHKDQKKAETKLARIAERAKIEKTYTPAYSKHLVRHIQSVARAAEKAGREKVLALAEQKEDKPSLAEMWKAGTAAALAQLHKAELAEMPLPPSRTSSDPHSTPA